MNRREVCAGTALFCHCEDAAGRRGNPYPCRQCLHRRPGGWQPYGHQCTACGVIVLPELNV